MGEADGIGFSNTTSELAPSIRATPGASLLGVSETPSPFVHFMKTNKERIVCGTDFSPLAAEAASVAALLAVNLGETLVLVHVTEGEGQSARPPETGDSFFANLWEKLRNEADRLRALGAVVRDELLTGSPYETLIGRAKGDDAQQTPAVDRAATRGLT